jgi:nucleoid DNA-binding protein
MAHDDVAARAGAPVTLSCSTPNPQIMATITKREIVKKICDHPELNWEFSHRQVAQVVQLTIDLIIEALAEGDTVALRKFGSFHVVETKEKVGRNPKDPEKVVIIPPRAAVKFKPGKEMKEKVAQVLPKLRENARSKSGKGTRGGKRKR